MPERGRSVEAVLVKVADHTIEGLSRATPHVTPTSSPHPWDDAGCAGLHEQPLERGDLCVYDDMRDPGARRAAERREMGFTLKPSRGMLGLRRRCASGSGC